MHLICLCLPNSDIIRKPSFCAVAAVVIAVGDDKITISLQRRALPAHSTFELVRLSLMMCLVVCLNISIIVYCFVTSPVGYLKHTHRFIFMHFRFLVSEATYYVSSRMSNSTHSLSL